MDNTEKLLHEVMALQKAFIESAGYDYEQLQWDKNGANFRVTKRKKQVKTRKVKEPAYTDKFNCLWGMYPKRSGKNPKNEAFSAYMARIKEGQMFDDMKAGLERYIAHCKAEDKIGTPFVAQARTFFGPSRDYLEEYALPEVKKEKIKLPFKNEDLEGFAKEHGLSGPGRQETYTEYRKSLQMQIDRLGD